MMKQATKFNVQPGWKLILSDMGINIEQVLKHAGLPADLFSREGAKLSADEYFNLWHGIEAQVGPEELPLTLGRVLRTEAFDAPFFAAICCKNLDAAVNRLKGYKRLVGPLTLDIDKTKEYTQLTINCYGNSAPIPRSLGAAEAIFFTQLVRIAARHPIQPIFVQLQTLPDNLEPYHDLLGSNIKLGDSVTIRFRREDAERDFLTSNSLMWKMFDNELTQRLGELDNETSTQARVRAVLLELLPSGESSIEKVAEQLAMSKRTLQRKLAAEQSGFQDVLKAVREELAEHYLSRSTLSLSEISFMLGFQESNSFIRAFSDWKGQSPGHYRTQNH